MRVFPEQVKIVDKTKLSMAALWLQSGVKLYKSAKTTATMADSGEGAGDKNFPLTEF